MRARILLAVGDGGPIALRAGTFVGETGPISFRPSGERLGGEVGRYRVRDRAARLQHPPR